MPPAARPCGRTDDAAKRSSCASEVMNTSSADSPDSCGQLHRPHHPVAVLQRDQLELVPVLRVVGQHPLDHALGGAQRHAAPGSSTAQSPTTVSPRESAANSVTGVPPASDAAPAPGRQRGQLEHVQLDQPPGRRHQPDRAADRGPDRRDDHVVGGASRVAGGRNQGPFGIITGARRHRSRATRATSPVADISTTHGSSATSSGTAAAPGLGAALEQDRAPRGAELLGHLGQLIADQLAQPRVGFQDLGQRGDLGPQLSCSRSSSSRS